MTTGSTMSPLTMRAIRGDYFLALNQQLAASWARQICSVYPTDQEMEEYPWIGAAPNLRKWEGERTMQQLRTDKITLVNDEYETGIEFRVKDLRRDKTAQMQARVRDLAARVATFPDKLLTALIVANGNAYTGSAYFGTHVVGNSGNIVNALTAGGHGLAGGATPTTDQQSKNLLIMMQQLMGFLDDQGEPLNETARQFAVMVPVQLWAPTVAAIAAAFTSASATNPLAELIAKTGVTMVPMLNARLSTQNQQYMFRMDAGIRPFILQEETVLPAEIGPDSERAKLTNKAYFGHGWSGAVGYGRPELAVRGTLS